MARYNKTENFFTRHVKLITFLCTLGAFLLIFGPVLFYEAADYYASRRDERPEMTISDVAALSEQGFIKASQLTAFASTESDSDLGSGMKNLRIEVDDGRFLVMAVISEKHNAVTECYIYDMESDYPTAHDVLNEDIRALFIK